MFNKLVIIEKINVLPDTIEKLKEVAKEVIYYTSSINKYVLENCKNIKYIGMCCSLYSKESANVDIETAEKLNITVKGVRDYGDEGVAEYIIHELVRFLGGYNGLKWADVPYEITNLKCGVIGLGTSGTLIARTLKFFKADVSYFSRTRKEHLEKEYGFIYKDLNTLCKESEAVFLALNKNVLLLQKEQFDLMKGKRILFNTSIGPGFDVDALEDWLQDKNHYFFGDTLATIGNTKLWDLENTFTINRSSGGQTHQAFHRLGEKVLNNIKEYLNN